MWVEVEVPDDAEDDIRQLGGFSVSVMHNIASYQRNDTSVRIVVAGDAHHFTDTQLLKGGNPFVDIANVSVNQLYQFSMVPPANVVLEITGWLQALALGVMASALLEFVKTFVPTSSGQPTVLRFVIEEDGRRTEAVLETNDLAVANNAIDALVRTGAALASGARQLDYSTTTERWLDRSGEQDHS